MKANEFIRKFGWSWAKEVVDNQPEKDSQIFNPYNSKYSSSYTLKKGVSVSWLRTYVESHELVESYKCKRYNGLSDAKDHTLTLAHIEEYEEMDILKKAIANVESCL